MVNSTTLYKLTTASEEWHHLQKLNKDMYLNNEGKKKTMHRLQFSWTIPIKILLKSLICQSKFWLIQTFIAYYSKGKALQDGREASFSSWVKDGSFVQETGSRAGGGSVKDVQVFFGDNEIDRIKMNTSDQQSGSDMLDIRRQECVGEFQLFAGWEHAHKAHQLA